MTRKACLSTKPSAVIGTAVLVLMLTTPEAKANCQDLLGDDVYRCRVKSDNADTFTDCFRFVPQETPPPIFGLFSDVYTDALACACQATGSFRVPEFGAANSFHCVSPLDSPFGFAVEGTVRDSGRVILGQAVDDVGSSFMFRCTRARSCELPLSTQGAPSTW